MEIFGSVPFSKLLTSNFTPRLQELFLEMCHSLRNLTGVAILPEGINIYMRKPTFNFAQWRYTNQWPYREVVLLLVENWIPIPRLEDVKYHLSCQFLMVLLQTRNDVAKTELQVCYILAYVYNCTLGRYTEQDVGENERCIGNSEPMGTWVLKRTIIGPRNKYHTDVWG